MISRRIIGELRKDWSEGMLSDNTAIINDIDDIYLSLQNNTFQNKLDISIINYDYNKHIQLTILFDNTYPFRAPKVKVNTTYNYLELMGTVPYEIVKQETGLNCLCCNSILCNWGPSLSIKNIVNECHERLEMKLRQSNITVAEMCVIKKFGHYLPIAEFL
mgnify:CR=1 FL=1|tara:strand:- start:5087 stop:5569 length:483 start_codon:yes stop_codon:yes gene_type:complete